MMDPYQVLGISRNATPEEIKKAYRQKAKLYHPDLHPDDPSCNDKMNEINEAYDRLTHPEKFKDTIFGNSQSSSYGGYQGNSGSYGSYQNGSYGSSQNGNYGSSQNGSYGSYQNGSNSYGNSSGSYGSNQYGPYRNTNSTDNGGYWYGGTFYNDIFGFGRQQASRPQPQTMNQDSQEIINVIYYYRNGQYDQAQQILNSIVSTYRNDRWYYLSAIVNNERGQKIIAMDHIQKAMQMAPYNQEYKQAYMYMNRSSDNYETAGRSYNGMFTSFGSICMWYMLAQCFCMFCH